MHPSYAKLRQKADGLCALLADRYQRHLVCRAGCSGCCQHHLSVFEVEAFVIRNALARMPREALQRLRAQAYSALERKECREPVACPLLLDECCAAYDHRPIICRTQGLPLLMESEEGALEVDFCPLNFTALDAPDELEDTFLIPLEELNRELVLANLEYCRNLGLNDPGSRIRMADIILSPFQGLSPMRP